MRSIIWRILLLGLCLANPALAADEADEDPAEFDVEIIIVRNVLPDDTELRLPVGRAVPEDQDSDERDEPAPRPALRRFPALKSGDLRLSDVRDRLTRSENWSPILHYGWRQPAQPREAAAAMSVAGSRLGAGVTGTVRLSLDRFLRLELDLELDPSTGELYEMHQGRRLRSGQVHYFDHPQFGVVALVSRAPQDPDTP